MKKLIYLILLIAITTGLKAQFAGVLTNDGFTRLENDSVLLTPDENLRGIFQWQKSADSLIWIDVDANLTGDILAFVADSNEVYRLMITEGTCSAIYGDTIKVFNKNTGVSEYLSAGISVSDLLEAEVSVYELFYFGVMVGTLEQSGADSLELTNAHLIGIVTDYDGADYKWVRIGDQRWMAENLKAIHYDDGTVIPLVEDGIAWDTLKITEPAYCYYNNSSDNGNTYGALYTWEAAVNACPSDWHVPDDAEWEELRDYLGGEIVAGGKMKETGISHWTSPNAGATNESGFMALPAGYRHSDHITFYKLGDGSCFWSTTELGSLYAGGFEQSSIGSGAFRIGDNKTAGYSVRCIMD